MRVRLARSRLTGSRLATGHDAGSASRWTALPSWHTRLVGGGRSGHCLLRGTAMVDQRVEMTPDASPWVCHMHGLHALVVVLHASSRHHIFLFASAVLLLSASSDHELLDACMLQAQLFPHMMSSYVATTSVAYMFFTGELYLGREALGGRIWSSSPASTLPRPPPRRRMLP
jgi:hypothetical protein